jgi:hypothetical protein
MQASKPFGPLDEDPIIVDEDSTIDANQCKRQGLVEKFYDVVGESK